MHACNSGIEYATTKVEVSGLATIDVKLEHNRLTARGTVPWMETNTNESTYSPCALHLQLHLMRRAAAPVADDHYLRIMLGCAHEQKAHGPQWAGSIDVANTNAVCDIRGPYHSIWSTMKPAFWRVRWICCTSESLRCQDIHIWRFLCWQNWLLYPLRMHTG
jgi:hypothetical protein